MNSALKQSELITPERIQFSLRARFNPLLSLTPELLISYLDSFRLGFFRNSALMWAAMELCSSGGHTSNSLVRAGSPQWRFVLVRADRRCRRHA